MARSAKTSAPKPAAPTRKAAPARGKVARAEAPAPAPAPVRVPPPSKAELRAQIEKLEAANATLKAKGREAARDSRAAKRRIAELEAEVGGLRGAAPAPEAPPLPVSRPPRPARRSRRDPGDAVPPGVAVQEPEPLDAEAEAARAALEEHLSGE